LKNFIVGVCNYRN